MKEVNLAFQQLSQNQKRLAELFNTNLQSIGKGFEMTDAWLHVQRRVINDQTKGDTVICSDKDNGIDYTWYFRQYNAVRAVIGGLLKLKENYLDAPVAEQPKEEESNDLEFGGDYAH